MYNNKSLFKKQIQEKVIDNTQDVVRFHACIVYKQISFMSCCQPSHEGNNRWLYSEIFTKTYTEILLFISINYIFFWNKCY